MSKIVNAIGSRTLLISFKFSPNGKGN
jgi:hypothetical protein